MGKARDTAVLTARADLTAYLRQIATASDSEVQRELGRKIAFTQRFLAEYGPESEQSRQRGTGRQFKHVEARGFKVRGLRKAMHTAVKKAHQTWYGVRRTW